MHWRGPHDVSAHSPKHVISEADNVVRLLVVSTEVKPDVLHFEGEHGQWRWAIVNHNRCPFPLVPLERRTCFGNSEIAYTVTKLHLNLLVYLKRGGWSARGYPTAAHSCRLFGYLTIIHLLVYYLNWNIPLMHGFRHTWSLSMSN
jgi:hypothetical protein